MGTTLTGLTPATTYDALIKVGDNGPLSATAKYVGDGLGNDSVVALSTSSVGIGTTSPTQLLHVAGNVRITGALYDGNNAAGTSGQILSSTGTATDWIDVSSLGVVDGSGTANYVSKWSDPNTLTNSVIYDNGTNVGIGTASPTQKLVVESTTDTFIQVRNSTAGQNLFIGATSTDARLTNDAATPITFNIDGAERVRITSTGNVGIGNSSPVGKLHIAAPTGVASLGSTALAIRDSSAPTYGFDFTLEGVSTGDMSLVRTELGVQSQVMTFKRSNGNVGIGTTSPAFKLEVNGNAYCTDLSLPAAGGIYFDSGASKYLDDYEIGTWTMGVAFGGASVGVTYFANTGTYTKIGRQVTVNGYLALSNKGSSTGAARITGLPFTIGNSNPNFASASLWLINVSFANQFQAYGNKNTTTIVATEITEAGVATDLSDADFANNSEVMVNFTYFV